MTYLNNLLSISPIQKTRRHHALEHATLQILSRTQPHTSVMGYSDVRGFWLIGNVSTEAVRDAVDEALARLQTGEAQLAIHPNCGTNYVVSGLLAGSAAWLVMAGGQGGWRRKLQDWPVVVALSAFGFILGQPLGLMLQAGVTTDANPGGMKVVEIRVSQVRGIWVHRVLTRFA